MRTIITLCVFALAASALNAQWVQTNGPEGGIVNAFAVNGTTVLAGISGAGVYRSTNDGTTWTKVNSGLSYPNTDITSFAASGASIYMSAWGGGVFRSTNDGANWMQLSAGPANNVHTVFVNGTNLFAGTGDNGVYHSTNNGTSWKRVNTGLTNRVVRCFALIGSNLFAGTEAGGVFLSTNNGDSWAAVNSGLTSSYIRVLASIGTNLFAGTDVNGVFLSTNNGTSWSAVNTGLTHTWMRAFAVSGTTLFAGTEDDGGVFLTTDNGSNWSAANTNLTNLRVHSLAVQGSNLFAGTKDGVYVSTNNGSTWTAVSSGLVASTIKCLAVNGSNLFAGVESDWVFRSTDNGGTWNKVDSGLTNKDVEVLVSDGTRVYVGTYGGGVYRSTDNGTNWTQINNGLTEPYIYSLLVNGADLYAGTWGGGAFRSTDNGNNWTSVNSGLTNLQVLALASNGPQIYAGTFTDGVFLSTNNGTNWTAINTGITDLWINALAVLDTEVFAGTYSGVFRSTNNGTSWSEVNTGIGVLVTSFTVVGTRLFAGTIWAGVYLLNKTRDAWTYVGSDLWNSTVNALAVSNGSLCAGTWGGSVWRRPLYEMVPCGTISGVVFNDSNQNASRDLNEPGLAGWKVLLKNIGGVVVDSCITDALGAYEFTNVESGTFTVVAVRQSEWQQTLPMGGGGYTIVVVNCSTHPSKDFGIFNSGLVAYYPFNGNANDESGSENHGTVNGATLTADRWGNPGKAYLFNGSNSTITCGNEPSLQITGDITVCAWVKTSTLPSSSKVVVSKYGVVEDHGWLINTPNDASGVALFDGRDGSGNYRSSGGTIRIGDNRWHFVVGQREGSVWKVYVDGWLSNENDVGTAGSINADQSLTIGAQSGAPGNTWWNGSIDDIRIYNRALSDTEIDSLYHEGGYEPSLISGMVFHDIDGNGQMDGGDTALAGWKVFLENPPGAVFDSQLTNSEGKYEFYGLTGGTYMVVEAQDTNWIQTAPSGLGTYTITLAQGDSTTGNDFGNALGYRYTGPSGNWSQPSNWVGAQPPGATDAVLIPGSVTVTVDLLPSDSILALKVAPGGTLQFAPQVGRLRVAQSVQVDPGASLTLPLTSDTTGMVCYKDFVNRGTFEPGHSTITFAGSKPKIIASDRGANPFYKLEIAGDSTRTQGNLLVHNRLMLGKDIAPRLEDSIFVESNDTSVIADVGKIVRGTIRRQIRAGERGKYRFESPASYVQFLGTGSYPTSVTMTCLSDTTPSSFQQVWQVDNRGVRDTLHKIFHTDSIPICTRWVFGIPRPRRWLKSTSSEGGDSVEYGTPVVRRLYAISTEGAGSDTLLAGQLQLRYDAVEVPPDTNEADLVLLHGPLPTDSVEKGWNMVSVPLVPAGSARKSALFPGASSRAFAYEGTYDARDTLDFGTGYWLKFPSKQLVVAPGFNRLSNTIPVMPGWNLIGSISEPVAVSTVTSEPPGLVTSQFYGYKKKYTTTDTIYPCRAYWVKVRDAGVLNLFSLGYSSASILQRIRIEPTNELPPAPPEQDATVSPTIPMQFALEQNYPNPFNPTTIINYSLPDVERSGTSLYGVNLRIYDVLGREVATLVNEVKQPGEYTVRWNASGFASGVYFYRMSAVGQDGVLSYKQVKKMLLTK